MDKSKLLPLLVAGLILIGGLSIYFGFKKSEQDSLEFSVKYKSQVMKSNELNIGDSFVVKDVELTIESINDDFIILSSSDDMLLNSKKENKFNIKLNKETKICFSDNDCLILNLK